MMRFHSISELASELGITQRTIRFYEEQGLLAPERVGSQRIYSARDRARLILILRGKKLGFSLRDIAEYLDLYDADPSRQTQIAGLVTKVRERIAALESQLETAQLTIGELREIEKYASAELERDRGAAD